MIYEAKWPKSVTLNRPDGVSVEYSFKSFLSEFVTGDPRWQSSIDWLDDLDLLLEISACTETGDSLEMAGTLRDRLLEVMRDAKVMDPSTSRRMDMADWLRPQLTPFYRAILGAKGKP